ncbi:MerR family transcriptional regulator [Qaidamihabitans albus]|uniref:MerR family transcriptional regulator n=1 Tax=Qaidamihabitans albus TaxID=2795733 RepID=UPI0018F1F30F|nr:MerR family transcriptional regulator [Qaidamihabitans albus]
MAEYRVDDLARAAGTTVGNVRVYQDRDLLPPPIRHGRVALYSEAHLARLRLILGLLDRGYTFAQIRELISAWESGRDLGDLLGLEQVLTQPWTDEAPQRIPYAELKAEFGPHATPDTFKRLERLGVFKRDGSGVLVRSPRLLNTGRELLAAGVPMAAVLDLAERVQRQTNQLAALFVQMVEDHVLPSRATGWTPSAEEVPELTDRAAQLRPLAQAAVSAFLSRSMSHELSNWIVDRFGPLLHQHETTRRGGGH